MSWFLIYKCGIGVPIVVQRQWTQLVSMRMRVWSQASLSGLRIQCCCELCRSQMWLRSGVPVTVAQAGSWSSNWPPSLGTSMCCICGPKKLKKKKPNKQKMGNWILERLYYIKFMRVNSVGFSCLDFSKNTDRITEHKI